MNFILSLFLIIGSIDSIKLSENDPQQKVPYTLSISLDETAGNANLLISVELKPGAWFVSPYSKERFMGHFNVSLDENPMVSLSSGFIEIPRSTLKSDRSVDKPFYKVTESTNYEYKLEITDPDLDFDIKGMVQFVIEPQCTMEKIEFSIKRESGMLSANLLK